MKVTPSAVIILFVAYSLLLAGFLYSEEAKGERLGRCVLLWEDHSYSDVTCNTDTGKTVYKIVPVI